MPAVYALLCTLANAKEAKLGFFAFSARDIYPIFDKGFLLIRAAYQRRQYAKLARKLRFGNCIITIWKP